MLNRVLDPSPCDSLDAYRSSGGGQAVAESTRIGPDATIDRILASGLRGRGGAGFPTGVKWRTVADAGTAAAPTPVVVNAAEGEPGTFKDRTLLRRNPYKVIEGAVVAALTLGSTEVVIATKASFTQSIRRLRRALAELEDDPFSPDVHIRLVFGPDAYLFGEETALLEVIEGRQPFPRIAPPFRRGLDPNEEQVQRNASRLHLAVDGGSDEPPALVDNVETLANVPAILTEGSDWFRSLGTADSPGTIICTVTGHTRRHGVAEYPMGTPLSEVIAELGGGARVGRHLLAAVSGVANPLLPADRFDIPLSYEAMASAGTSLGAGGFIIFDDTCDPVSIAHGISRLLAVESCGQCEPCKADGLAISAALERIRVGDGSDRDLALINKRLDTVIRGARCFLAYQQQRTVASALELFGDAFQNRPGAADGGPPPDELIAPVVDILGNRAVLDNENARKQPDWTYGPTDSGAFPAALYGNSPVTIRPHARPLHPDAVSDGHSDLRTQDFAQVRMIHRELDELLERLENTTDPDSAKAALTDLDRTLQRHHDITDHILYPTVSRAVPGLGDDAAWTSEHAAEDAERLAHRLAASHQDPSPENLAILREGIDEHIAHVEHFVVPLLRNHLAPTELEHLDDAMATALAHDPPRTSQSTASVPADRKVT